MADIFLSYARADQAMVEKLANNLEAAGYSLWWDRNIEGGHHFAKDIQRELEAAKIVIVAWSKTSVDSHWVLDEAGFARDQDKLLPIALDGTLPPLGFRQVQSIDFQKWPRDAAPLETLSSTVDRRLERQHRPPPPVASKKSPPRRSIALALGALALLAAALAGWYFTRTDEAHSRADVTIAVLPFTNSAGEQFDSQRQSYPSAIIDGLGDIPTLDILSARTSFAEAATNLPSTALAEKLGSNYLIEGDIQRDDESLRITARIVDGATGRPIWSGSRHGSPDSLPELQRRSVRQIAGALQGQLGIGLGHLPVDTALTGEALDQYRNAMTSLLTRESSRDDVAAYNAMKRAVELAPGSADAHAGLAWVLTDVGPHTLSMDHDAFRAENRAAYDRALALDPDSLFAKMAKAETIHKEDGDIEQALALIEDVKRTDPDFGPAHFIQAPILDSAGDYRAALRASDRALALSPYDQEMVYERGRLLTKLGNYDTIKSEALACTVDCAAYGYTWAFAIAALVQPDELESELERFLTFAREGRVDEAELASLSDMVRSMVLGRRVGDPDLAGSMSFRAIYHARMGDEEAAFEALERLIEGSHAATLRNVFWNGRMELPTEIRAKPRFRALFEEPKYRRIVDYRRAKGILHGLPIEDAD